jgi:hypothetical protein
MSRTSPQSFVSMYCLHCANFDNIRRILDSVLFWHEKTFMKSLSETDVYNLHTLLHSFLLYHIRMCFIDLSVTPVKYTIFCLDSRYL